MTGPSLFARTARGAGWVMAWRMGMRVLGLTSTLVLVRLLAPADFGLIALAAGFMQTIDEMMALGTEEAVIRQRAPGTDIYNTAFTLTALRGLAVSILVLIAAYPAAAFFGEPRLGPVLLVIAALPLLDGIGNIGAVDFRRALAFEKEFAIMVLPKLCGIIAAIGTAFVLHSYVAMLAGMLVNRTLRCVMTYVMHPFRPRLSLRAWRELVGYSLWSWVLSLAILLRNRADSLILGRLTNATTLGFYSVGAEIAALPTTELIEPLCRASFSGFAAAHHSGEDVSSTYLRLMGFAAMVTLPAGMGLSLIAAPLVRLALGPGWDEAVPVLQVLAVAGTMMVFGQVSLHLMSAHALLGRLVGLTVIGGALRVGLLLALIPAYGALGAAIASGIAIGIEQGMTVATALKRFHVSFGNLLAHAWRPMVGSGAMTLGLCAAGLGWQAAGPAAAPWLVVQIAALGGSLFAAATCLAWHLAGRPEGAEADILRMVRRYTTRP